MKNYHLTPAEQETIISWDNELDIANIYTHDRRIAKRLLELSKKHPGLFVMRERGCQHCYTFTLPKHLISIRQPYSEERKKRQSRAAKEYVKIHGSPFAETEETP